MLALQRFLEPEKITGLCAAILFVLRHDPQGSIACPPQFTDKYSANIVTTDTLLKDAEHSLLCGDPVADVPELARVCVLLRSLEPDKVLTAYQSHLKELQEAQAVSQTLSLKLVAEEHAMAIQMASTLALSKHVDYPRNAASATTISGYTISTIS